MLVIKKKGTIILAAMLILALFSIFCLSANATGITQLSDQVTRMAPSTASDHTFTFKTASGLQNSGDYFRLTFRSGDYNFNGVTFTDMSFSWGITGNENIAILAAAPSATEFGVNVSGTAITFTHPTDNATGDIAAGNKVIIHIGASRKIINPATMGTKIIDISGSSGEIGSLAVVVANDGVGVDSTVGDIILNNPTAITSSGMTLSWTMYGGADFVSYQLYYATHAGVTNADSLWATITDVSQLNTAVTGLTANTQYYFVIYLNKSGGAPVFISNEVTGTTTAGGNHGGNIPPAAPTITADFCPIFISPTLLVGGKEDGSIIFINNSTDGVTYPSNISWQSWQSLVLYIDNIFNIFAQKNGLTSSILTAVIQHWRIGDTQGNKIVDDFDLSNMASHWNTDWCYADFYRNHFVDDFDLSGLAWNWDRIY